MVKMKAASVCSPIAKEMAVATRSIEMRGLRN